MDRYDEPVLGPEAGVGAQVETSQRVVFEQIRALLHKILAAKEAEWKSSTLKTSTDHLEVANSCRSDQGGMGLMPINLVSRRSQPGSEPSPIGDRVRWPVALVNRPKGRVSHC